MNLRAADGAGFALRRATAADAAAMWTLRQDAIRQTCRGRYPDEMLERWASSPLPETFPTNIDKGYFLVGVAATRIAGFAALNVGNAEVDAVFVAPDQGRRGLGRLLLAELEAEAIRAGLRTLGLSASLNAVAFYRATGYHALRDDSYTTSAGVTIACVRMEKQLTPVAN